MTLHTTDIHTAASAQSQDAHVTPVTAPANLYSLYVKRALDLTLVLLSLPVIVPLILMLALLVAATGTMPFYSQERVGRNGTSFRMWKLRTMVKNADAHLETHLQNNPDARQEWDSTQKLKNDPRITPFGRILRKTSIDELPQLFNVLNGTMSLVGPRPMMVHQKPYYPGHAYFEMRPGITGLWQVSDRNDCAFRERAAYDSLYYREMSLQTDIAVLLKTVGVVCKATGH